VDNVFRGMFGYLFLITAVRLVGRRLGTQLTPFDTVVIFFLGGTVLGPVLGDERSTVSAMASAAGIAMMFVLVGWLKQKSSRWAKFFDGTPLTMIEKDKWQSESMRKLRLDHNDVMAAARSQGIKSLDQIDYAILERNGLITVIRLQPSR